MSSINPEEFRRVPGSPQEWLDHAESDLRSAQLAGREPSIRRELACFHAQQAAEKAIKAVPLRHGISFPPTHNIEHLLPLAERGGVAVRDEARNAGFLTPYAVETRYPGPWPEVNPSELEEALEMAEQTLVWARRLVSE